MSTAKHHFGTPPGFWTKVMNAPDAVADITSMYETPATRREAMRTKYADKRISYTGRDGQSHIGTVYHVDTDREIVKVRRGPEEEIVEVRHINHVIE